jgi:hypothetical protein
MRHLGHFRFRVSLGLHVYALGNAYPIVTRSKPLGNSGHLANRPG